MRGGGGLSRDEAGAGAEASTGPDRPEGRRSEEDEEALVCRTRLKPLPRSTSAPRTSLPGFAASSSSSSACWKPSTPMADSRRPLFAHSWEEEECLEYYGMLPLHRMFEVVGAQLTQNDVEVLSFLLDETQPWRHPLDPELWAVAAAGEGAAETASRTLQDWRKKQQQQGAPGPMEGGLERAGAGGWPKDGVRLLLELERRGKCDETNFVHLLQLLRVLTRHDLLPYVTLKRQRTVSPERYTYGPSVLSSDQQVDNCLNSASAEPQSDQWETGSSSSKRKRVSRGRAKSAPPRRRRGAKGPSAPKQEVQTPTKVTCGKGVLTKKVQK